MRISKVSLSNIRGYENAELELSSGINLIIGENNSGKTTILKSLLLAHDTSALSSSDLRINEYQGSIEINFTGNIERYFIPQLIIYVPNIRDDHKLQYFFDNSGIAVNGTRLNQIQNQSGISNFIFSEEPNNFREPRLIRSLVQWCLI